MHTPRGEGLYNPKHEVFPDIIHYSVFSLQSSVFSKKPSPRGAPVGGMSEGQGGSRFRRGEGVDQRETDEGTAFPKDAGFGEAVCLPRIMEVPHTLC